MQSKDSEKSISISCPACGLLCDDLRLVSASPIKLNISCTKGVAFFEYTLNAAPRQPSVAGQATDLNTAIQAAVTILKQSQTPLFAGLGTEVQGMRAILQLANKTGATLDHMHSEGMIRNTLALQNSGWQNTTLTEVKNRATVIFAIGTDIVSSHPRFFEKLVWNSESLFNKPRPEVIYLAVDEKNTTAGISPEGKKPWIIPAEIKQLPEIMNVLNALLNQKNPLHKKTPDALICGIAVATLLALLEKLKSAQYVVVVWAAGNFKFSQAELTVQSIIQLIAKINETTRIAGLPLNAGDGDVSVNNTSTWLSGYPIRSRHVKLGDANPENINQNQQLEYDPHHFSCQQQLKNSDALIWISTFNAQLPPNCSLPTIVIGHPSLQFERMPDVFIPVGVPGIDHAGTQFRMDNVVALPLKKLRQSDLPSLSQVIQLLTDELP
ncbi:MAG: formylmethanofuran dehydrogenase [Methylotenera sp.]|nr:formylmethanofuran dehydrogenase [Methylotenera sp.]